jgi:uncharacterized repeat protein (TIGR02543 family)
LAGTLEPGATTSGGDCHGITPFELSFTTEPGGAALGLALNPQPSVSVEDRYGNVALASSAAVTLAMSSGGSLIGCKANPAAAVNGVASFKACTVKPTGTYGLRATSGSLRPATSSQFTMTAALHTATFNANGGTGTMASESSSVAAPLTLNAYSYAGRTFTGWNTAANGSGTAYANGATYPFTSNVTLFAQWRRLPSSTVTFNANGGGGAMAPQTDFAPTPLSPCTFTRTGSNFTGWNTAANGSGTAYSDGATYPFTSTATLYAQWTPLPTHTVTFDANGGTGTMAAEARNVAGPLTTNGFTNAGNAFAGWNTADDGSGTAYADAATYPFASSVTLYAQWTPLPTHTVTFDANGGTGAMAVETRNVAGPLTANGFTNAGNTFTGWNTAANGSGTSYANGATYSFASSVTLYAQWVSFPSNTASFDANGGSGMMGVEASSVAMPLTANGFTYAGHSFTGWNTASDGSGTSYADGATYSFASSVLLYAQWAPLPTTTVTFLANGGTGSMASESSNVAEPLSSNGFAYAGHAFAGWNAAADGSGTGYADAAIYPFTSSVALYAQWTPLPAHTVTFVANGGTGAMAAESSNVAQPLTANDFTRSGYAFSGWNTGASGAGVSYPDGGAYPFTSDVTLYAQWTSLATIRVTFDANGGAGTMAAETSASPAPLTANAFTKAGSTFQSWNTAADGSGTSYGNGATYPFAEDVTLYALWVADAVLPGAPTISAVLGGDGAVTVRWTAPASDGGAAITSYTVTSAPGWRGCLTASTSCVVAGLTNGMTYRFTVAATNVHGTGPASAPSPPVTPATTPGPVRLLGATVRGHAAIVAWVVPTSDGGAPITSYLVTSSTGRMCRTRTTRCAVGGLAYGKRVRLTVVAINRDGPSTAPATSPPVVPHLPGRRTVSGFAEGSIRISSSLRVVLFRVSKAIKADGDNRVVVYGYTDDVGSPAARLGISLLRARRVVVLLRQDLARLGVRGIAGRAVARGASSAIASNSTAAGRAKNRRVLVVFS